uniref:Transcription factor CBF/NF-Y/archaeal histone domain-containing protein n=1 Tax=Tetraselmis chuii TaxID=63592 RepID=A0A7S1SV78_9CHLO|mmetsp:Transcript_31236/g.55965  ORF Transcript_31236/g.55965 Transcript_31236/m.55965 type:complete len:160 (+) Transcript_31236:594-1073(+)|eukprot:CAMPEP_0177752944 /NCGR_PEP_ID=MMETSP0491_2-20121128/1186_1 /TAXON_ID=63592 /ORGANISM="Tetraselmis chuii, Strain PLY429" /LENGTH=159 /DNA_ID=CAMNT_0019268175 /DNA_START=578 /DNA_END=1057 /DNA_ORIENTATION=-
MSANEQHIYGADGEGSGSEGSEDTEDAPEFEATPRRTPTAAVSTLKEATTGVLPVGRVKRIMKQEQTVKAVAGDATFLIAKATEMFLEGLASRSAAQLSKAGRVSVTYSDVASSVAEWKPCNFLRDIVPKRMSPKELLLLQQDGASAKRRKKNPLAPTT